MVTIHFSSLKLEFPLVNVSKKTVKSKEKFVILVKNHLLALPVIFKVSDIIILKGKYGF